MFPKGIEPLNITSWENAHQNFKHTFRKGDSFALRVFSQDSTLDEYNACTQNIQWLIKRAQDEGTTLRAMGNNWSFSPVAMCSGGILSTKALNMRFKLGASSLALGYAKTKEDLLFVQCGMTICELNELLEVTHRRCIRASGGSNGQSIAGATSTGTHGGALFTGAVHDAIVGLHIVTGANRHVWLERESYPVASDKFIQQIGAEAIRDDAMFNAAVVSFGSFGVIHGIMLETEPLYLLEEYRFDFIPYNEPLKQAISEQDIPALRSILNKLADESGLPQSQRIYMPEDTPDRKLYHLEIAINPQKFSPNNKDEGIYIRTFYKVPAPASYKPQHAPQEGGKTYGEDTTSIISQVTDKVGPVIAPHIIRPLVNSLFQTTLRAAKGGPKTIGEIFCHSRFRGQIASAAFSVDVTDVFRAMDVILNINKKTPLAGGVAMRFVKGTPATLGFTHYPRTCVVEMDGVDAQSTRAFFEKVWTTLESKNIPYTLHWGKLNFILNEARVRKSFGDARVNDWLHCREALMDEGARKAFTNDFMKQCGLDKKAVQHPFNPSGVIA